MGASRGMGIVTVGRALVYLVYFFVMLALAVLVMGFFLLSFGANPDASFAEWVYRALDRAMKPFRGIFQSVDLSGNSVLDVSVVFAMIVYGMLALALRALIDWLTYRIVLSGRRAAGATSGTAPAPCRPRRREAAGEAVEVAADRRRRCGCSRPPSRRSRRTTSSCRR
jgi:uncharacterized protein YggT (Ycf19 family)